MTDPTFPCMDQFIDCWFVPGWTWGTNYRSSGFDPGEAILGWHKWCWLPIGSPVNWAGIEAQVETMVSTVQQGHWAITDAIVEKRIKARGLGHPKEQWRPTGPPQQHTELKSGCEAWRKTLLKQSWELQNEKVWHWAEECMSSASG